MATQIQLRRGTTAQHSSFTGAIAEVTVDTDKDTVIVHDGSKAGGYPLATENQVNDRLQVANASVIYATKATALSTNNAIVNLINDRMQVANVSSLITSQINTVLDGAPGALDTLNELAAAIGDDANFATTITTSLATKASNTYVNAQIGASNTNIRTFANQTFETKAVALASNNALLSLINDRLQVANAAAIYQTIATERAALANTNTRLNVLEAGGALATNTYIVANYLQKTSTDSQSTRAELRVDSTTDTTGVHINDGSIEIFTNTSAPAFVDFYCEVTNAHRTRLKSAAHADYSGSIDLVLPVTNGVLATQEYAAANSYVNTTFETKAVALSSNNAQNSLILDRLQVSNAASLFVNVTGDTMSGALAMGTNKITGMGNPTAAQDAATKTYVDTQVAGVVDSAPETLNTLNELAAALGDDANFATSTATSLGTKAANTYVNATFATKAYAAANTYVNAQIGASNTNIRSFTDTTYETKAVALAANSAQNNLILDRMQVANAAIVGRDMIAGAGMTGGGTLAADRTFNVIGGTGITVNANDVQTNDSEIVHDNLSGFVANEHIDHSGVTITAGAGMTGGGTIAASRTLNVIAGTGITVNANDVQTNDSEIVHDNLSGFVANEHIDHSGVTLTAGNGLTGGGTIASSRSFAVGAGTYITVNANDVAVDATSAATVSKVVARDGSGDFAGNIITAVDFNATSDITLKENIHTIENPLEKVNSLRGVNFDWKNNGSHSMGVIAQEVENILPEVVSEYDGVKNVSYGSMVAVLIEALKEQQKQIDELKQIINNV